MAYFRSDIDIIGFFLLGGMKMSGSEGLFNKKSCFFTSSGAQRWAEREMGNTKIRPPWHSTICMGRRLSSRHFVTKFYFVRQNSILSDKILFCPTKFYFVRQNSILSDKILFCPTKFYFVRQNSILSDKILFCPTKFYFVRQNSILSDKILFCPTKFYFVRQNSILSDKILFCYWQIHFVDKMYLLKIKFNFVKQNWIRHFNSVDKKYLSLTVLILLTELVSLHGIVFCWQNWIPSTELNFVHGIDLGLFNFVPLAPSIELFWNVCFYILLIYVMKNDQCFI